MTGTARDVTEEMFNRVREKTDWPIDTGDCLWGYFFLDTDLSKLMSAGSCWRLKATELRQFSRMRTTRSVHRVIRPATGCTSRR